jgi:hypothetical protein
MASALSFLIYVGFGIIYGSWVGLPAYTRDLPLVAAKADTALVIAVCLWVIAYLCTASCMPSYYGRTARYVLAALVSPFATALSVYFIFGIAQRFRVP